MSDNVLNLVTGGKDREPLPTKYTITYQGVDGMTQVKHIDGWIAVTNGMTLVLDRLGRIIFGTQTSLVTEMEGEVQDYEDDDEDYEEPPVIN